MWLSQHVRYVCFVMPVVLVLALSVVLLTALPARAADTVQSGEGFVYSPEWKKWQTAYHDGMLDHLYGGYIDEDFLAAIDDPEYLKECKEHPEARVAPKDMPIEEAIAKKYTTFYNPSVNDGSVDAMLHSDSYKIPATEYIDGTVDAMNQAAKSQHYYVAAPTKGERMLNVGKFEDIGRVGMTTSQIETAENAGMSFEQIIAGSENAQGAIAVQEAVEDSSKKTAEKLMEKGATKAEAKATAKAIAKTALKPLAFGFKAYNAVTDLILAEQGGVWVGNHIARVAQIDQSEECRVIKNGMARWALGINSTCGSFELTDQQMAEQLHLLETHKLGPHSTCIHATKAAVDNASIDATICFAGFNFEKMPSGSLSQSLIYDVSGPDSSRMDGNFFYIQSKSDHSKFYQAYTAYFKDGYPHMADGSAPNWVGGIGVVGSHWLTMNDPLAYLDFGKIVKLDRLSAFNFVNPDGSKADGMHWDVSSTQEQPNICTLVTMQDGTQHVQCGGKVIKTDDGNNLIQPPDVYYGGDNIDNSDHSDHSVTNNVKEVKVVDVHADGSTTDLGGGPVSGGNEGYLDLWNTAANVSCFNGGEACADWASQVKTATGEDLSSKNKHTTKTDTALQYACRWYEPDGKTFQELPIGECTVYKDTFKQENQAKRTPYTDPKTNDMPENPVIPKDAVAPKFDFGSCITKKFSWNPVSWVFVPVSCALQWAFVPDTTVMTTQMTLIRERTGGVGSTLDTAFREHYQVFGHQQQDCKGPEFSLAFQNVQIIPPSYPMSVCEGSGLEFLPKFSKAAFIALYGYACLLVLRKWFFGISGFNPDSLAGKDGKK